MSNLVGLRIMAIIGIMTATTAGFLAFAFMKFPDSLMVIIPAVALGAGVVFFVQRAEKTARFNVYYKTVQEIGTPVSFGGDEAAFERNGTRFDVQFPRGKYSQVFTVNFSLPNIGRKFSIQNRTLAMRFGAECGGFENCPLPPE